MSTYSIWKKWLCKTKRRALVWKICHTTTQAMEGKATLRLQQDLWTKLEGSLTKTTRLFSWKVTTWTLTVTCNSLESTITHVTAYDGTQDAVEPSLDQKSSPLRRGLSDIKNISPVQYQKFYDIDRVLRHRHAISILRYRHAISCNAICDVSKCGISMSLRYWDHIAMRYRKVDIAQPYAWNSAYKRCRNFWFTLHTGPQKSTPRYLKLFFAIKA